MLKPGPADERVSFPHAIHQWRRGRRVDNHVYEQRGPEPSGTDLWIGSFPRPGDAEIAVAAVNAVRAGFCGETDVLRYERDEALAEVERLLRVEQALSWLVRLKDGPRNAHYHEVKPDAWAEARAALAASESDRTWLRGLHTAEVGKSVSLETENAELRAEVERLRAGGVAADVSTLARELHTLIRNGKEFPYADAEEQRYYELVVTRWLEKIPAVPVPDQAPADWCPECSEGGEPGRCEPGACPGRPYPESVPVPDQPTIAERARAMGIQPHDDEVDLATERPLSVQDRPGPVPAPERREDGDV